MKPLLFVYFLLSALTFGLFLFLMIKEFQKAEAKHEPPGPQIVVLILAFVFLMFIESIAAITVMLK